jgi:putative toxin-antitoxin system antitoxin component (TIGR02293 family)
MTVLLKADQYLAAQRAAEPSDHLPVVELVREGLPVSLVEEAAGRLGISVQDLVVMGILAARTVAHSRKQGRFSPQQSDRVSRFFRVFQHGMETFGGSERARRWFERPTRPLGDSRPADLLDTDEGAQLVDDLLTRIDHGLAA